MSPSWSSSSCRISSSFVVAVSSVYCGTTTSRPHIKCIFHSRTTPSVILHHNASLAILRIRRFRTDQGPFHGNSSIARTHCAYSTHGLMASLSWPELPAKCQGHIIETVTHLGSNPAWHKVTLYVVDVRKTFPLSQAVTFTVLWYSKNRCSTDLVVFPLYRLFALPLASLDCSNLSPASIYDQFC